MSNDVVLQAQGVHKSYTLLKQEIAVLNGVNVTVQRGETVCIQGASGAGKSTLLHVLGGLENPTSGSVSCMNEDLYRLRESRRAVLRSRTLGFVFQSYHLIPELDVLENVLLPARSQWGALARMAELRDRARELLSRVGLEHRLTHRPLELSGGEQQRVALARALMNEPEILLADEPTGNLDANTGEQVLEHLFGLVRDENRTLVVVTHSEAVAAHCTRNLRLVDGVID